MSRAGMTFVWKGDTYRRRLDESLREALTNAAIVLADGVVRIFGVNHGGVPSRPGDPPHSQTGHLRNSIGFTRADAGLSAFVGTNVPYGRYLNDGTSNIEPRPWAVPAVNRSMRDMSRVFVETASRMMIAAARRRR